MENKYCLGELLSHGTFLLKEAGIAEAAEDARYLLLDALKLDLGTFLTHREEPVGKEDAARYLEWIQKRANGCPAQYITGTQDFMGLTFCVDPRVLIPRMDTEVLVEAVLTWMPRSRKLLGADLCTGSGCIAISLLSLGPSDVRMYAADLSKDALNVAAENARRLGVSERLTLCQGDLFDALPSKCLGTLDYIVSNPPYIPTREISDLDRNVREYEPNMALDGGADGLDFYREIIKEASMWLVSGGMLFLEIGCEQGAAVQSLLQTADMTEIQILQDLEHRDRVAVARKLR